MVTNKISWYLSEVIFKTFKQSKSTKTCCLFIQRIPLKSFLRKRKKKEKKKSSRSPDNNAPGGGLNTTFQLLSMHDSTVIKTGRRQGVWLLSCRTCVAGAADVAVSDQLTLSVKPRCSHFSVEKTRFCHFLAKCLASTPLLSASHFVKTFFKAHSTAAQHLFSTSLPPLSLGKEKEKRTPTSHAKGDQLTEPKEILTQRNDAQSRGFNSRQEKQNTGSLSVSTDNAVLHNRRPARMWMPETKQDRRVFTPLDGALT